ncbi:hypothetical protein H6S82_01975 [Planktothrix sp. FACHB-1355]|uniref:Ribbon-helix-helix protein CopG domain-containing protein n=1 Tax=Aerosakkonema funiforme FACHB-1375 TaxID=2949571 RepID=A0A926ZEZ4_9CYAN|nr:MULTISPECIES: hypothetical protein [Oscillatoriales]MBD2180608.1 hypothetical protein [Aerosakkonema funiforme FACHB-1375]MBD3557632.1 hypothetical protein [Planktothrix sp. FACHB-1355]
MPKKGIKSKPGQGEIWDEPKSEVITLRLTPTARNLMESESQRLGISRSELIERVLRLSGSLPVEREQEDTLLQILKFIHNLSISEIAKVLTTLGRVLNAKTQVVNVGSVAELVEQHKRNLELGGMKIDRINAIATGAKPSKADIIQICTILDMDCAVIQELVRKSFGQVQNGFIETAE